LHINAFADTHTSTINVSALIIIKRTGVENSSADALITPSKSRIVTPVFQTLCILNAVFFLFYGFQSLISRRMIEEFKRFGLSNSQRKLTGTLQLLGSAGLVTGFMFPMIGLLAAGGFTVMMLVAFIVRIKIKDSLAQSLPSLIFMLINGWLSFSFYGLI